MQASAVSSADTVRALLEAGADVNASIKSGASALMWATGDTAKVRLLLGFGVRRTHPARAGGLAFQAIFRSLT